MNIEESLDKCAELAREHKYREAWSTIEGYRDDFHELTEESKVSISVIAYHNAEYSVCRDIYDSIISEKITTSEYLLTALNITYNLNDGDNFAKFHLELNKRFTFSEHTMRANYLKSFKERDFTEAQKIATQMQWHFDKAHAYTFSQDTLAVDDLLNFSKVEDSYEDTLLSCTEEAIYRKDYTLAHSLATRANLDAANYVQLLRLRVQILPKLLEKGEELTAILKVAAQHPDRSDIRRIIENDLDEALSEPDYIAILGSILSFQNQTLHGLSEESVATDERINTHRREDQTPFSNEIAEQFAKSTLDDLEPSIERESTNDPIGLLIGTIELPESVKPMVSHSLVDSLQLSIGEMLKEGEMQSAYLLLNYVVQCCKKLTEHTTDLRVALTLTERHSLIDPQSSRDFAETVLLYICPAVEIETGWRNSIGWACLAEACLRSNNAKSALLYQTLSLLAYSGASKDNTILMRSFRRSARIMRDLRFTPFAALFIGYEAHIHSLTSATKENYFPLEAFQIHLNLGAIIQNGRELMLKTLKRTLELEELCPETEIAPITSIQANLIAHLGKDGVDQTILDAFEENLTLLDEIIPDQVAIMRQLTSGRFTSDQIRAQIKNIPPARVPEDLSYQIRTSIPLFSKAITQAITENDSELFCIASAPFTQPCMSPKQYEQLLEGGKLGIQAVNHQALQNGRTEIENTGFSYDAISELTLDRVQSIIREDEELLIIVNTDRSTPAYISITNNHISSPAELNGWSSQSYSNWKNNFKEQLECEHTQYEENYSPLSGKIDSLFDGLGITTHSTKRQLIIIPCSELFGFTWNLLKTEGAFMCEYYDMATSPSLAWLTQVRTSYPKYSGKRVAWLGSKTTQNIEIASMQSQLSRAIGGSNIERLSSLDPEHLRNANLAIIGAHGNTSTLDYFSEITDGVNIYSPNHLSSCLKGAGCVILAVCNSGRSDTQTGTSETLGLVSSLLKEGVRCVIAPPWPIDPTVVEIWLPKFIQTLDDGKSAGEAFAEALQETKKTFPHPCAWTQLHLYGDSSYTLTN